LKSVSTDYEDVKDDAICRKWGGLGRLGPSRSLIARYWSKLVDSPVYVPTPIGVHPIQIRHQKS